MKILTIIRCVTFSILLASSSLLCFSQDVTTRVPDGIGMTENYDFYVFWLNNESRISYAISLAYATGIENKIHISPYIVHTPNKSLFRAVVVHEVAHYYNFFSYGEIEIIDTLKYNYPIDSNYWKTPPDLKKIVYKGGDGYSVRKAIINKGATTLKEGIGAEYAYLEKELGQRGIDWKPIEQYLHPDYRKMYDIIKVNIIGTNETKFFCFDITEFFGKF